MRDASFAWKECKNNFANTNTPVIGGLSDTSKYKGASGYNVLDTNRWNLNVNDAWVKGGIDRKTDFALVSPEIQLIFGMQQMVDLRLTLENLIFKKRLGM